MADTEGHHVSLGAMKTARQLLARAKKKLLQNDLEKAPEHLNVQGLPSDDELKLGLDFSPLITFGGVLTAIWLFFIHKTGQAFVDKTRLLAWIESLRTQRTTELGRCLRDQSAGAQHGIPQAESHRTMSWIIVDFGAP